MLTRHLAWVFDLDGTLTVHQHDFDAIRAELGIPEHIKIAALIPMGWPARDFGPVNRQPVERFVHRDGWEGEKRHHGPPL